ncbi:ABC transporter substrate-binding protein [Brenneria izadpanahii]|uniref:ABC transporter substrate-binding protein n=1 Tax=Brenneria izadpanahii TaxID=2722756 RepID=A0ABX7UWZ5_9GAMM|nr:ABC transporter substrate-binding protein [Brenneria izadpanahii]QTF10333.1 ABC transporter substrate-binding protein [Brenneria izadpanahii]
MKLKSLFAIAATLLLFGVGAPAMSQDKQGGILTIATVGEPPTLDQMQTPTDLVGMISQHIYETLYTFDDKWQPKPLLAADMPMLSEDGLTYTIPLRKGVTFHDGSAMTSADVVASLQRWEKINSKGKQVADYIDSVSANGGDTVIVKLKSRYSPLLATLSQAAIIMPAAKIQDTLTEFVGTGPYMLKERKPDQYIQLVRFPAYQSPEGAPSNYAGERQALADELRFVPVPDANTRVEGLLAGQYDYADSLPFSAYARVAASDKAQPVVLQSGGWASFNMNMKEGLFTNKDLRNAVQAALNPSDMMMAAFSDAKFYHVDGAYFPQGYFWHTEAGVARYGEGDPAAAGALLKKAGYKGTPIRLLTSRQYEFHYKMAEVAKAYLEAAGFKVDLQVTDWATLTTRRADPSQWDIFITHSNFPGDPTMMNTISDTYPGWYVSAAKTKAVDTYLQAVTPEEKFAAWEKLQATLYDDAPLFKVGNFNVLSGLAKGIQGYEPHYWPTFWNVPARS